MFIGILVLNTLDDTKYIKIETSSKELALLKLKEYANKNYNGQIVRLNVIDTLSLDSI